MYNTNINNVICPVHIVTLLQNIVCAWGRGRRGRERERERECACFITNAVNLSEVQNFIHSEKL